MHFPLVCAQCCVVYDRVPCHRQPCHGRATCHECRAITLCRQFALLFRGGVPGRSEICIYFVGVGRRRGRWWRRPVGSGRYFCTVNNISVWQVLYDPRYNKTAPVVPPNVGAAQNTHICRYRIVCGAGVIWCGAVWGGRNMRRCRWVQAVVACIHGRWCCMLLIEALVAANACNAGRFRPGTTPRPSAHHNETSDFCKCTTVLLWRAVGPKPFSCFIVNVFCS